MHLIFEQTTSVLYYSNDGRLRLAPPNDNGTYVLLLDGVEVFATKDRIKSDAYIAGYDLAIAHGVPDAFQLPVATPASQPRR